MESPRRAVTTPKRLEGVQDGGVMTPLQWERCLSDHYLRSDGPLGGSPITFLDATPAELAAAAVEHGVTEQTAQLQFVS